MPAVCISDNGTNFVAGHGQRELKRGVRRLNSTQIIEYTTQKGVEWRFNPPGAPHFGGTWERLARSAKRALGVTLQGQRLTDEVLLTVMIEVDGLLNGRTLTHVSHHPEDVEPLTPNHFLLGRPYAMIPPDVSHPTEITSRRYWRAAQTIVDHFWRRWIREYLSTLNKVLGKRSKQSDVKIGDVVLVVDTSNRRGTWPLGRAGKLYPGPDGIVRVVDVETNSGTKRRPVIRLVKLFQESEPT
uniref:Integrase catalytic domain-containing protein n=1 Tax=Trichuris muris TaxID=70415 RepID=A0A5S6Q7D1_TRIMR